MKLLIVDDEIYAIQGILDSVDWKKLNFEEVLTANSYAQAVNEFVRQPIDVLLCDIEMPYGSGLDLVEWVKGHYPETECIFLTCHSDFDFARQAIELQALDYVLKPAVPSKIEKVLQKAIDLIEERRRSHQYEDYGRRYINELSRTEDETASRPKDVVEKVKQYIQAHISENISVDDLAGIVYLSADHLRRIFKKQENITIVDYIIKKRMELAKTLLERDELTITMISAKVGYNNYSYFTKMFKKMYGMTPREYQHQCRRGRT